VGAIAGGTGAALAWAFASLCAARSSRAVGPWVALAWVMAFGLLILLPLLALSDRPHVSTETALWLASSGVTNIGGLLVTYRALQSGPIGVVAPIVGAEGGVTAVISVLAGQPLAAVQAVALAAVLIGVFLVAWRVDDEEPPPGEPHGPAAIGVAGAGATADPEHVTGAHHRPQDIRLAALLATAGALIFGVGLYTTGRAGDAVPMAWAVLPARLLGVFVLTLPLALRGRLRLPRAIVPFAAAGGCLEVIGFLSFTAGAGSSIAITAVLASLTGAVAAGLGRLFFAEHLSARQLAGVAVLVVAVGTLGAVT
jgi:drug/metabolite transporter (DMT)-like permease